MFNYIWPVALIVFSNIFYHISAKSVPENMHPMALLVVSYAVASLVSLILYYVLDKNAHFTAELTHLNWAAFVMGVVMVGLEAGYLYAYKVGWAVGTTQIVQSAMVAVVLIFVGFALYNEPITLNKILGISVCLSGLVILNI